MQQWRNIQTSHQIELLRLQHPVNFTILNMNSVGRTAAEFQPADDLQRLQTRISFLILDMDALGCSCSGEAAMDFQPAGDTFNPHTPPVSLRDFLSLAPAIRPSANSEPEVPNQDEEPRPTRGSNTPKPLVSITSSPEARGKRKHFLLVFSAASAYLTAPRERKGHYKIKRRRQRSKSRQMRRPKSRRRNEPMASQLACPGRSPQNPGGSQKQHPDRLICSLPLLSLDAARLEMCVWRLPTQLKLLGKFQTLVPKGSCIAPGVDS